ncbi:hypothetical protein KC19_VG174200 [Ceratodon purpureus]|uniref:Inositol polyphosphate-related phosphatase domain-containing protein n=1 Tax=Ceratodon purpureus TaxID=3225 RepID=A0A8T0HRH0_CERPU|nr:hypothetical protein KC19_VG174200 [Ceratodon purpureus]
MRSSTAGMLKGRSSGGTPAEAPLIDFGVDDHNTGPLAWPEHVSGQAQDVDPFSWTTDELFISATSKDPFGFEGHFTAAITSNDPFEPVARSSGNVDNTVYGFALQSLGHGSGTDLLTGMPLVATRVSAPASVNSFLDSSGVGDLPWAAASPSGHRQSVDSRLPVCSSDDTFYYNDNPFIQAKASTKDDAQPWSPFYGELSFKDALSEDLPIAESPTSEGAGDAVDWSSIVLSEKKEWLHEDQGSKVGAISVISNEQARSPANSFTEKEQQKPPVATQVKERSSFSVIGKDVFRSEDAISANAELVAQMIAPPQKPPSPRSSSELQRFKPPVPRPSSSEFQSSAWVCSSRCGRQQPEFLASGGRGVYRAPSREIFNPGNPVALELRPRPLKLKEVNQSIRTIMCTETSVWASFEHGLKVWDIEAASSSCSEGSNNPLGDEDAASYTVLTSGPTLCLAMDTGNQVVWTGHRDGKVRAWPLNIRGGDSQKRDPIEAVLVWDGHQTPVTAITITPYGELWTGSENGQIKAWPCEVTSRALQSAAEGYQGAGTPLAQMAVLVRGHSACNNPSQTEVRVLLAEHSAGRVWSGGIYFITIWDARTRETVYSFEAQTNLASPEFSVGADLPEEKLLRKEKSMGWLQRSRNALNCAADAVRRAADRLRQEEARRLETLAASEDGTVWGGFGNGHLVQWDSEGTRLGDPLVTSVTVKCLLTVGSRLWVGFTNGRIEVLSSSNRTSLGCWGAQSPSLAHMAKGGNYVFTLSADGGILGWHVASLSPLDTLIQDQLFKRSVKFTQNRHLRIFAGTWNVSQEKASSEALRVWLEEPAAGASLVCIGLQEMEMGAGSIGLAAVKETVGVGLLNKGSANGQWWLDNIGSVIGEGKMFERVGDRQLAGLLIGVWARRNIRQFVGDVDAAAVACGFGRTFGNKGAVGVKLSAFRRTICLVNSHFAAHMDKVTSRNSDFEYCYNQMTFGPKPSLVTFGGGGSMLLRGQSRKFSYNADNQESMEPEFTSEMAMPELSDTDVLIWLGDFNYRIDTTYDQAVKWINEKRYDMLLIRDQLRVEMTSGRTFPGMREAGISFPPTYKFDRGTQVYDTSEKRRVPAYCDRVVFRDSFDGSASATSTSLTHPSQATVVKYDACMEALDSDHKPVQCLLGVDLAVLDEAARRREYGDIMMNDQKVLDYLEQSNVMPQTRVNRSSIVFENSKASFIVTNYSQRSLTMFMIRCDGLYIGEDCPCGNHRANRSSYRANVLRGGSGFPLWLQVLPAAGVIGPNSSVTITIHYRGPVPQNHSFGNQPLWWTDLQMDECLNLVLTMSSSPLTKLNQHRICVRRAI